MKTFLKRVFGPHLTARFRESFPSLVQRRAEAREIERKSNFYASFVNKGDICFDVGANMGNRITPLLEIGASVVAVEPQESCYKYLDKKFGNKISLVKKGLGEAEAVKVFHLSDDSTISSFSDDWISAVKKTSRFKNKKWDKSVSVEMTTVDNIIKSFGHPSFIKIDVEGYELEVLKGLTRPVNMISFEYTVPEQPGRAVLCIAQIEKYNNHIECNYSIGEDLVWALKDWLPAADMKQHIFSEQFNQTCFGDIYIRTKANDHAGNP
ncbi:FkbM family methyltransferase [Mucilaginibacter flavus]|uniref:FkbM family methyltransferase n=1 Tax=Mucilaginibacter flavus TaxID=931504 RepID=UPI0025B4D49C|nr:FkbM family methyltransferase [Mucilaginibacter flavus]MDN3584414.1 FkbM family methyltransferase [Mucilaginibacter flavus]